MKYTYRFPLFRAMEADAVERYLKRMAAKGLQLESAGTFLWKFRRTKPAALTYAVTYFPEASAYGGPMTPEQQELADYCAAAGWTYVTQWQRMQIYATDLQDPVPLETDEALKLDLIQAVFRKHLRPTLLIMVVLLCVLALYCRLYALFPSTFRTHLIFPAGLVSAAALFLILIGDLLTWRIWLRRARKEVERGYACPPSLFLSYRILSTAVLLSLSAFLFIAIAVTYSIQQNGRLNRIPTTPIVAAISYFFVWLARKRGWDQKKFKKIYTICAAIAIFLYFLWLFVINDSHTR